MVCAALRTIVLGATLIGAIAQVAQADETVAAILAAPKTYDGKQVTITGRVSDALMKPGGDPKYPRPPDEILTFCDDTGCLKVVVHDAVAADPVARWSAHGTFWIERDGSKNFVSGATLKSIAPVDSLSPTGTP
jgi:hypothetical protein